MPSEIRHPDWRSPSDRAAVVGLLDTYARGVSGGGAPLTDSVKSRLCDELSARASIVVVLAFVDGVPAGLCISNEGFSTFACKPLLNIHDLVVAPDFRGRGIGAELIGRVEEIARARGCCKLTLEVLENNSSALSLYRRTGFVSYELDPSMGRALFLERKLG